MRIRTCLKILCILVTVSLTACSAVKGYGGATLPDERVAIIDVSGGAGELNVEDVSIDGHPYGYFERRVAFLPGQHSVSFTWSYETSEDTDSKGLSFSWRKSGRCDIAFQASAGEKYSVTPDTSHTGTWVTNPSVQVVVSLEGEGFLGSNRRLLKRTCSYDGREPSGIFRW